MSALTSEAAQAERTSAAPSIRAPTLHADDAATVAGSGSGGGERRRLSRRRTGRLQLSDRDVGLRARRRLRLSSAAIRSSTTTPTRWPTATRSPSDNRCTTNYLATVRPRIGIARRSQPRLHHRRRGVHQRQLHRKLRGCERRLPPAPAQQRLEIAVGWTAGAGWEYALADHWTVQAEYLFASFPTTNALGTDHRCRRNRNTLHGSTDLVIQLVRAGVNFKF